MWQYIIPAAISAVGSFTSARQTNRTNVQLAENQMAFQERLSGNAYQRSMSDMLQAGLNPMLAYSQGGASTPAGQTARVENELAPGIASAMQMAGTIQNLQQIEATAAQVNQINAETDRIKSVTMDQKLNTAKLLADINQTEHQTTKTGAETTKVRAEADMATSLLREMEKTTHTAETGFAADVRKRKADMKLSELALGEARANYKFFTDEIGQENRWIRLLLDAVRGITSASRAR